MVMLEKLRRSIVVLFLALLTALLLYVDGPKSTTVPSLPTQTQNTNSQLANDVLDSIAVKGRAPKTDYKRSNFGDGWEQLPGCDTRNYILKRDMIDVKTRSLTDCTVASGKLNDLYTSKTITFVRGAGTSDKVQIDHVVALSDAWQKGAQGLSFNERVMFANDGLNLLAVDGKTNQDKSDSDAASWLPPNKAYRCLYVARQLAVKQKYRLWITSGEKDAMKRVLNDCPDQKLPVVN